MAGIALDEISTAPTVDSGNEPEEAPTPAEAPEPTDSTPADNGDSLDIDLSDAGPATEDGEREAVEPEKPAEEAKPEEEEKAEPAAEPEPEPQAEPVVEEPAAQVIDIVPAPEALEAAVAEYESGRKAIHESIKADVDAALGQLQQREARIHSEYNALEKALTDEDGVTRGMTPAEAARVAILVQNLQKVNEQREQVLGEAKQREASSYAEHYVKINEKTYPALKEYHPEFVELTNQGKTFDSIKETLAVCKALAETRGRVATPQAKAAPEPKKPTEAAIKQAAIQANMTAKQKAKIGAGSGSTGAISKSAKESTKYDGLSGNETAALKEIERYLAL